MLSYEEMLKVVANDFVEQGTDDRQFQEVYDHMLDWMKRGYLSRVFIDDCYDAVMDGRPVIYNYDPGKTYGCLFAPKGSKMNRAEMLEILSEMKDKPVEVQS